MIGRLLAKHAARFAASERFRHPSAGFFRDADQAIAIVSAPADEVISTCVDPHCTLPHPQRTRP